MLHSSLQSLIDGMPRGSRLVGLDIGDKTVGVAISDPLFMVASPMKTINRGKKLAPVIEELKTLIKSEEVGGLVAGLPVSMDGTEGPRCQSTRQFAENLEIEAGIGLPIALWDERLSTSAVEKFLINEADMTRKRRGQVIDKMAAAYILQGALDAM